MTAAHIAGEWGIIYVDARLVSDLFNIRGSAIAENYLRLLNFLPNLKDNTYIQFLLLGMWQDVRFRCSGFAHVMFRLRFFLLKILYTCFYMGCFLR